jgi:hypothetical protein
LPCVYSIMVRKVRKDPIPHFRLRNSSTSRIIDVSASASNLLAKGCFQGFGSDDPDDSNFRAAATFSINSRVIGTNHLS